MPTVYEHSPAGAEEVLLFLLLPFLSPLSYSCHALQPALAPYPRMRFPLCKRRLCASLAVSSPSGV